MPVDDTLAAVLRHAQADVGVLGVELVQPGTVVLNLAAIPAEVVVVALYIGNVMHGAVNRGVGDVGNGGQTGGVQLLHSFCRSWWQSTSFWLMPPIRISLEMPQNMMEGGCSSAPPAR